MITMLGQEGTDPAVRRMTDRGRQMHRDWGHEVRVVGHAQQRGAVESSGAEFVAYRHARLRSFDQRDV